ncbi:hypothetical protein DL96DRAFT_1756764 [Flagelloscypha sp. PMI_526]|nr:hypothetical protein DL96DRAFT_1756764 [Flagelloscypha sp. PMI_526]
MPEHLALYDRFTSLSTSIGNAYDLAPELLQHIFLFYVNNWHENILVVPSSKYCMGRKPHEWLRVLKPDASRGGRFNLASLKPLENLVHPELKGHFVPSVPLPSTENFVQEEYGLHFYFPNLENLRFDRANIYAIGRALTRFDTPPLLNLSIVDGFLYSIGDLEEQLDEVYETLSWMCQMIDGATNALAIFSDGANLTLNWARAWLAESEPSRIHLNLTIGSSRFGAGGDDDASRAALVHTCQALSS